MTAAMVCAACDQSLQTLIDGSPARVPQRLRQLGPYEPGRLANWETVTWLKSLEAVQYQCEHADVY